MLARGIERNRRDIHLGYNILLYNVGDFRSKRCLFCQRHDLMLSRSMSHANRMMDFDFDINMLECC